MAPINIRHAFFKSSLFNAAEKLIKTIVNFIIFALMNQTLSVEQMGQYNFYIMSFAILSVFASFGITENATKIFLDKQSSLKVFKSLLIIKLFLSIVFAVAGYFLLFDKNIYFFIGLIFSCFTLSSQFLESLALGKLILKLNTLVLFITLSIKVWACLTNQNLLVFSQIFAFEILLQTSLLLIFAMRKGKNIEDTESYWNVIKNFKYSDFFYIWFSASVAILYVKVDQLFVNAYLTDLDVGYYTFATRIIDYGMLLPSLIISSLMGFLYNIGRLQRTTLYSSLLVVAIFLVIGVNVGSFLLVTFYLPQYNASLSLILVLSVGLPFALLRVITGKFLIIDGTNSAFLVRSLSLLILNVVLCFVLVKPFGLMGAAMANMLTIFTGGFLIDLLHKDSVIYLKVKYLALLNFKKPRKLIYKIKKLRS